MEEDQILERCNDLKPTRFFYSPFHFFAAIAIPVAGFTNQKLCRPVALGALVLLSIVSVIGLSKAVSHGPLSHEFGGWAPPIGIEWVIDGLSGILMVAISIVSLIALVQAGPLVKKELSGRLIPFLFSVSSVDCRFGWNGIGRRPV